MTTETNLQTESTTQTTDVENKGEVTTLEQALEKIKSLELINKDVITTRDKTKEKLRKYEESAGASEELKKQLESLTTEKGTLLEQFEATKNELNSIKEGIKAEKLSTTLQTALEAAGVNEKAIPTAMKLVDKAAIIFDEQGNVNGDSVISAINTIKTSDPFLFGEVDPKKDLESGKEFLNPGVKRAGDGSSSETAYQKELQGAIAKGDQRSILEIMRKYNVIK